MFKFFHRYFPSRLFILSNMLFWLILNTIAADNTHRTRISYDRESDWLQTWFEYLPWWGNWAIMAPFIIAGIRWIDLDESKVILFALKNLCLMVVTMLIYWSMTVVEVALIYGHGELQMKIVERVFSRLIISPLHMDALVYLAVASLGFANIYYSKSRQQAVNNEILANQLLQAELKALKSQLSPHFLFNALNTISGLVRLENKSDAVKALSELSKMFRKVLENQKNQLTELRNEIEFINSYLAIQTMRFENKLAIETEVSDDCLDIHVPFMLLHTLVENAVQHGSQLESDKNLLQLKVKKSLNKLHINLTNKASKSGDHKGFGIGLENCRQRLKHIYGSGYLLTCSEQETGFYNTKLILPIGEFDA